MVPRVRLVVAALLAGALAGAAPPERDERPNVLIIMTDQFTPRALGCMGNPDVISPNIDRLAEQGALFRAGYCNDPVCGPSRYSMFTGLYPTEIGAFENGSLPREGFKYIPEYLNEVGYFTANVGKTHFVPRLESHGFQESYLSSIYTRNSWSHYYPWAFRELQARDLDPAMLDWKPSDKGWEKRIEDLCIVDPLPDDVTPEAWTTAMTLKMIERAIEEDVPFFLHASYFAPHHPYAPLQEYLDLYEVNDLTPPVNYGLDTPESTEFGFEGWRKIWHYYYAFVTQLDHHVGALLDGLDELGVADDTLVFFVSDHGDMLGERRTFGKKQPYEGSVGVPFIVRWPERFGGGKVSEVPVSLIDVLPTILEAAALDVPDSLRGRSVLPLLDGREDGSDREVYSLDVRRDPFLLLVCREPRWKMLISGRRTGDHVVRLYDLVEDPYEMIDRVDDPAVREHRDRLKAKLDAFWERESKFIPRPLPDTHYEPRQALPYKE